MRAIFLTIGVLLTIACLAPATSSAATCDQYSNQADAQRAADTRDADGDGVYCESLPCPCLKPGQGSTGGGGGGGIPVSTPRPVAAPPPPRCSNLKLKRVTRHEIAFAHRRHYPGAQLRQPKSGVYYGVCGHTRWALAVFPHALRKQPEVLRAQPNRWRDLGGGNAVCRIPRELVAVWHRLPLRSLRGC